MNRFNRYLLALAVLITGCLAPLTPAVAQEQWGEWTLGPGSFGDLRWRSAVDLVADLPASGNVPNDVRLVVDANTDTAGDQAQLYRWDGDSWEAIGSASAGTVESVDVDVPSILTSSGGPITTSGTITIGLSPAPVSHVLVGPTAGFPAAPTFRALQAADIPAKAHAITHEDGSSDELTAENLASACGSGATIEGDGAGGLSCGTDDGATPAFSTLTSGTNTSAIMTTGDGAVTKIQGTGYLDFRSSPSASYGMRLRASGDGILGIYQLTSLVAQIWEAGLISVGTGRGALRFDGTQPAHQFSNDTNTGMGYDATSGGFTLVDGGTNLALGTTTDDDRLVVVGCPHYGARASAPTTPAPVECSQYVDTDDGAGNAAMCVYLDGAWVEVGGAGAC